MYVLGMLGASAYWQEGATDGAPTRDRRCCGINFLEPQPATQEIDVYMVDDELDLPTVEEIILSSHEVPYSLADTGASTGVVGIEWLERVAQELSRYDLAPVRTPATQKFRGLGGAKREAEERWTIPQYYANPGAMIGLTGRDDLEDWSTNLYLRKEGHWADSRTLASLGKS